MSKIVNAAASFALAFAALASPSQAQELTDVRAEQRAHEQLLGALQSEPVTEGLAAAAVRALFDMVTADGRVFAEVAAGNPEFRADFLGRFQPAFLQLVKHNLALGAPRKLDILKQALNDEEALRLADFYSQPLGQSLLTGVTANLNYSQSINAENLDEELDADNLESDLAQSARSAVKGRQFTAAEHRQLIELTLDPAFAKLRNANPDMMAVTIEIENRPVPPEFETETAKIMLAIFDDYLGEQ